MTSASRARAVSGAFNLASTHGDHHLDAVALGEELVAEAAARHDLAVALDGQALAREVERLEELRHGRRALELARGAVHVDADGGHDESIGNWAPAYAGATHFPTRRHDTLFDLGELHVEKRLPGGAVPAALPGLDPAVAVHHDRVSLLHAARHVDHPREAVALEPPGEV